MNEGDRVNSSVQRVDEPSNQTGLCPRKLRPLVAAIYHRDFEQAVREVKRFDVSKLDAQVHDQVAIGLFTAFGLARGNLQRSVFHALVQWANEYVQSISEVRGGAWHSPAWLSTQHTVTVSSKVDVTANEATNERVFNVRRDREMEESANRAERRIATASERLSWLLDRLRVVRCRAMEGADGSLCRSIIGHANKVANLVLGREPAVTVVQLVIEASELTYPNNNVDERYVSILRGLDMNQHGKQAADVMRLFRAAVTAWRKRAAKTHGAYEKLNALLRALGINEEVDAKKVHSWRRDLVLFDNAELAKLAVW